MEIAEEEEEEQRATKRQSTGQDDRPTSAGESTISPLLPTSAPPPVLLNSELVNSPEANNFTSSSKPPEFIGVPRPPSPAKSVDTGRRLSSQSTRPDFSSYGYGFGKPKVKLGPRPSLDVGSRPRTAGTFRPISTIPAGLKLFSRKGKSKDNQSEIELPAPMESSGLTPTSATLPIPEIPPSPQEPEPVRPHTSSGRPTTSSGLSIKSVNMPSLTTNGKPTMTPEKARLMRAMQLREKKKKMSMMPPPLPIVDLPREIPKADVASPTVESQAESESNLTADSLDEERRLSVSKADSGIVMDGSSVHTDQASEVTQSDSHPPSPLIASSEPDHSTKASSLSESTDETVHPSYEDKDIDEVNEKLEESYTQEPAAVIEAPEKEVLETAPFSIPQAIAEEEVKEPEFEKRIERKVEKARAKEPFENNQAVDISEDEVIEQAGPHVNTAVPEPKVTSQVAAAAAAVEEATPVELRSSTVSVPKSKFAAGTPSPTNTQTQLAPIRIMATSNNSPIAKEPVTVAVKSDLPAKEEATRSPTFRIPKSKFSSPDLKAVASASATETPPPVPAVTQILPTSEDKKSLLEVEKDGASEADTVSIHSRRSRRKGAIEPIRTDLDASEANLSDDEDLMYELQSAAVQEATPVTVSKSPISPLFPSPIKQATINGIVASPTITRTISNPIRNNLLAPAEVQNSSARSVSSGSAFLQKIAHQQSANLTPKSAGKIGSSISQRIKALEKLSGSTGPPVDVPSRSATPSSTFFSVRKSSIRDSSRSPSIIDRANSFSKHSPPSTAQSRDSSPEATKHFPRDRSGSVASRLTMFEGPGAIVPRGRPESIQVTARIVRDPTQPFPKMPEIRKDSDFAPLELKQSPLVVDHKKATPPPMPESTPKPVETPKETIQERRMSKEKRRSQSQDRTIEEKEMKRRSSLSIVKDFIKERRKSLTSMSTDALVAPSPATPSRSPTRPPSTHQNIAFPRRLSISSRRSSISKETFSGALSPSVLTETSGSGDENKSANGDKKKSRAGRFIRRLSSSLSGSRGKSLTPTGISPTVQEEEDVADISAPNSVESNRLSLIQQPMIISYMGDVNVQFPDNLLWKRRSMCLDSQGFLILSAVAATAAPKDKQPAGAGVKRYHLSDFRPPYTPEMEVQELPNSVILDFVDGSGLQIACEDRAGQLSVLHSMLPSHLDIIPSY
jgi:hypothetical protein